VIPEGTIERIGQALRVSEVVANKERGVEPVPEVIRIWVVDCYRALRECPPSRSPKNVDC